MEVVEEYDEKGQKYVNGRTQWRGHALLHATEFCHLDTLMEAFSSYSPRQDDVWICSFPKTGKFPIPFKTEMEHSLVLYYQD